MRNSIDIATRSKEEMEWWNKFADIMAMQWELTPRLNDILRSQMTAEYTTFLYTKNGTLLDVGCGNGWISSHFFKEGMRVTGVDFSESQIQAAKQTSEKYNHSRDGLNFQVVNVVHMPVVKYAEKFDAIIVNALLHHLSRPEITETLQNLERCLKSGGKLYLYEPVTTTQRTPCYRISFIFYYVLRILISLLYHKPINAFQLETFMFQKKRKEGYAGNSPHERPIDLNCITESLSSNMRLLKITPWHSLSMGYAMQLMALKDRPFYVFSKFVRLIYWLDRILLAKLDWQNVSKKMFVLCGIQYIKK